MGTPRPGVADIAPLLPMAAASPGPPPARKAPEAPGIAPPAARDGAAVGLAPGRPGVRHALHKAIAGHPGHLDGHSSSGGVISLLRFTLLTFSACHDAKPRVRPHGSRNVPGGAEALRCCRIPAAAAKGGRARHTHGGALRGPQPRSPRPRAALLRAGAHGAAKAIPRAAPPPVRWLRRSAAAPLPHLAARACPTTAAAADSPVASRTRHVAGGAPDRRSSRNGLEPCVCVCVCV